MWVTLWVNFFGSPKKTGTTTATDGTTVTGEYRWWTVVLGRDDFGMGGFGTS